MKVSLFINFVDDDEKPGGICSHVDFIYMTQVGIVFSFSSVCTSKEMGKKEAFVQPRHTSITSITPQGRVQLQKKIIEKGGITRKGLLKNMAVGQTLCPCVCQRQMQVHSHFPCNRNNFNQ